MSSIFVFGSNLAGIHGAGAAAYAHHNCGAVWGYGVGLAGKSYAIPTKNHSLLPLSLPTIKHYVEDFLNYARKNPEDTFIVTCIGCGLAGFTARDIAPMFYEAPPNCQFDYNWKLHFTSKGLSPEYWGTF